MARLPQIFLNEINYLKTNGCNWHPFCLVLAFTMKRQMPGVVSIPASRLLAGANTLDEDEE